MSGHGQVFVTTAGTLNEATRQTGEPRYVARSSPSVWYAFTPTESGVLRATTCDSEVDTVLAVYTGTAVGASAVRNRHSRRMSCAVASTPPVGGLRRPQECPDASLT